MTDQKLKELNELSNDIKTSERLFQTLLIFRDAEAVLGLRDTRDGNFDLSLGTYNCLIDALNERVGKLRDEYDKS